MGNIVLLPGQFLTLRQPVISCFLILCLTSVPELQTSSMPGIMNIWIGAGFQDPDVVLTYLLKSHTERLSLTGSQSCFIE